MAMRFQYLICLAHDPEQKREPSITSRLDHMPTAEPIIVPENWTVLIALTQVHTPLLKPRTNGF